jgi:CheY-like chemotaxis protein
MNSSGPVLLAEDDENDIFFMELAFHKAGFTHPLMVVRNGQETIRYLSGQGIYADHERYPNPCLVLLDISMPILTGLDVLKWLQHQPQVANRVPIVVLTSSSDPCDIQRAKTLGAADYRIKPTNADNLVPILRELQARWLNDHPTQGPLTNRSVGAIALDHPPINGKRFF